ncbi:OmpA family protein [Fulvivirga sp. 29W222]|uniref:OmpA family protein n=1 Tax=Fulvivirga marina TaxID=2494733 RepID=A0A937KDV5_9BACT|nr:OmpA family protein [Fulvivirga marina]MBL6448864.1 OmpA family protein [Fulvivirga marina]
MKRLLVLLILIFSCFEVLPQDSLIKMSIYFDGGRYYIDDLQVEKLQEFIQRVERLENYEVIIFSHTDNIGGREYNLWLSRMRSMAVIEKLMEIDVPREMIKIRDFGLSNPLYTNTSHNGRIMNRRVDVILWPVVF